MLQIRFLWDCGGVRRREEDQSTQRPGGHRQHWSAPRCLPQDQVSAALCSTLLLRVGSDGFPPRAAAMTTHSNRDVPSCQPVKWMCHELFLHIGHTERLFLLRTEACRVYFLLFSNLT